MPYSKPSEAPDYVPKDKRAQWIAVFNSAYERALKDGKSKKEAESSAFAQANGVAGPSAKTVRKMTTEVNYVSNKDGPSHCQECRAFSTIDGTCSNPEVQLDPAVPVNALGKKCVAPLGYCDEFHPVIKEEVKAVKTYEKRVPFVKVDEAKREVWGIVTAELPDKDDEVCDYERSKPYYEAVIAEMSKATDGDNFFPLRYMHQLDAVGKCIGYEFRDADREIFMGFKVVDDKAWEKVQQKVLTGFSHGGSIVGDLVPDTKFKGCMRYVANPAEVSLVDNPCLGVAHIAWFRADGAFTLVKVEGTEPAQVIPFARLSKIEEELATLKAQLPEKDKAALETVVKAGKTKRVAGEDLSSSAFAYVGDPEKTETWKLPIKFSSDAKTKRHIRNALARFSSTKGIPAGEKDKVHARIVAAAKQHGIDVDKEKALFASLQTYLRKSVRASVHREMRKRGDVGHTLSFLDSELGKLQKGMYEVSDLAQFVNMISHLLYGVVAEQAWEGDEASPLPDMLAQNTEDLLDTLVAMVAEETDELRAELATRIA